MVVQVYTVSTYVLVQVYTDRDPKDRRLLFQVHSFYLRDGTSVFSTVSAYVLVQLYTEIEIQKTGGLLC